MALVLAGFAATATGQGFVYVTSDSSSSVSQFAAGSTGALSPLTPPTVPGGVFPEGIVVSPDGRSAYVASKADDSVLQYDIGPGGGLVPKVPAAAPSSRIPVDVAVTPDGRHLYAANASSNTVSQYDVGPTGLLTPKSPAAVPAGGVGGFGRVAVSPDGGSLYVTDTDIGADRVSQYDIDAGGALTPKAPASVPAPSPVGIAVRPDGRSAYVTSRFTDAVLEFDVAAGGALRPKAPASLPAGDLPFAVTVRPDGNSVYVADGNSGTVSQYDVSAAGLLTPKSPRDVTSGFFASDLAPSADGRSLYVPNEGQDLSLFQNVVSQFDIDAGGLLTPKVPASLPVGPLSGGVAVTPLPRLPQTKADCRGGGWRRFGTRFKNQGRCVAFVVGQARASCLAERRRIGRAAFRRRHGTPRLHRHALRRCVRTRAGP